MSRTVHRGIRQCPCRDCRESPKSATAEQHRTINRVVASFDEKGRRLFVAYLASQSGRGAIEHLAYVWGGRDLRAVAPRSDSANFPGFFSILCSVFRDSVVTTFRVISWNSPDF